VWFDVRIAGADDLTNVFSDANCKQVNETDFFLSVFQCRALKNLLLDWLCLPKFGTNPLPVTYTLYFAAHGSLAWKRSCTYVVKFSYTFQKCILWNLATSILRFFAFSALVSAFNFSAVSTAADVWTDDVLCYVEWISYNKFAIDSLFVSSLEWSYLNTDICKFESSQRDENIPQSADSLKAYRKPIPEL